MLNPEGSTFPGTLEDNCVGALKSSTLVATFCVPVTFDPTN